MTSNRSKLSIFEVRHSPAHSTPSTDWSEENNSKEQLGPYGDSVFSMLENLFLTRSNKEAINSTEKSKHLIFNGPNVTNFQNNSTMAPSQTSSYSTDWMNSSIMNMSKPNQSTSHVSGHQSFNPQIHIIKTFTSAESNDELSNSNITFFGNNLSTSSTTSSMPQSKGDFETPSDGWCYSSPENYELFTSMLCSSLLVLGVVYFTYGYRCFRAMAFFTGLFFGTALAYTALNGEQLIDIPYSSLMVSLLTGLLVGLLTMLVTYIGLFVIGLHLGLLLGVGLLSVIYLLKPYFDVLQPQLSSLTLLIFFVAIGLVGSFSTIYFSKGCTIIASSLYGSALSLLCVDYFLENFKLAHWFMDNLSKNDNCFGLLLIIQRGLSLCLGSHIILALWPCLTLLGIVCQYFFTARGVCYRRGYGMVATTPASKILRSGHTDITSTSRIASSNKGKNQEETCLEQKHRKYRYLYQVRTAHGDVLSQHYFQSMQNNKKLCLPEQHSYTFNSDISSHFLPESRTTTLSVA